jgi:hypothetical protein
MTARVIQNVNADFLAVIEPEEHIALRHFNEQLLAHINAAYGGSPMFSRLSLALTCIMFAMGGLLRQ